MNFQKSKYVMCCSQIFETMKPSTKSLNLFYFNQRLQFTAHKVSIKWLQAKNRFLLTDRGKLSASFIEQSPNMPAREEERKNG